MTIECSKCGGNHMRSECTVGKAIDAAFDRVDKHQIATAESVGSDSMIDYHMSQKEVWNAAIEAAAIECEEWDKGVSPRSDIAPEIRKLKK